MVHPHMIMNSKRQRGQNCSDGVCQVKLDLPSIEEVIEFEGIGIRRVTSEETKTSLEMRKNRGIDPFNLGYINNKGTYNKEAVKLCFEVNLHHVNGKIYHLDPITSKTISHSKYKDMRITSLAPKSALCNQPEKLIILCENLPRPGDIEVVFTIGDWEERVKPDLEHHNCAVQISTPQIEIQEETTAEVRVVRRSNNTATEAVTFSFLPAKTNTCQSCYQASPVSGLPGVQQLNQTAGHLHVEILQEEFAMDLPVVEVTPANQEISSPTEIDSDLVFQEWCFETSPGSFLQNNVNFVTDMLNF